MEPRRHHSLDTALYGTDYRIPAKGGEPAALSATGTRAECSQRPRFLPDGRHFFYYANGAVDVSGIYIGQLDEAGPTRLLDAESAFIHQSSGRVLFVSKGTLYAQRFDMRGLALLGNRSTVAEDVAAVTVSDAGVVAFRTRAVVEPRQFVWFDRNGLEIRRVGSPNSSDSAGGGHPSLSPDGRYVAMNLTVNGNRDIWLLETTRGVLSKFTTKSAANSSPRWSPDGRQVVFNSNRSGVFDLYVRPMASNASDVLLLATPQNKLERICAILADMRSQTSNASPEQFCVRAREEWANGY